MVRKVKLNRSQVEMAKSMGIPLEDAAKILLPKRGRPVGSKNKPKAKTFTEEVAGWEAEPRQPKVDWQDLVQKLQSALAKSYVDYEDLQKDLKYFTRLADVHEAQLEIKEKRINFMEMELAQIKAGQEGLFRDEE